MLTEAPQGSEAHMWAGVVRAVVVNGFVRTRKDPGPGRSTVRG